RRAVPELRTPAARICRWESSNPCSRSYQWEDGNMRWVAALALGVIAAHATELKPQTSEAFDRYVGEVERKLEARKSFLWADELADRMQKVRSGVVVVEPAREKPISNVPDGFVHDWVGAVFIPGVSLQQTLTLVRDYDHNKDHFKPEVIDSKLL